jgi:hypothetical protein
MPRRVYGAFVMMMALAGAMPAFAQSTRKLGVVMGYPTAAGVIWHLGDRIALRPDVSWTRQQVETTTTTVFVNTTQTFTSSTDTWNTSLGLSALFYLGPPDDLRFYVSPRFAWLWTRASSENSLNASGLTPRDVDTDGYLVSGAFGAQYRFSDRFRLFGELGLNYSNQDEDADLSGSRFTTSITGFGLRSGVGVVVYF